MKRLTDEELQKRIKKRKAELDSLLSMEKERVQARQINLAEYLERKYKITTIPQLEQLLFPLNSNKEV